MELDELKIMWQDKNRALPEKENLLNMIRRSSSGPLAKMKANLKFEFIAAIILYAAAGILFLFYKGGRFYEVSIAYLVLGLLFLLYYVIKMKLLNRMQCFTCQVKSNLQQQVKVLEHYIRIYFWVATLSVPLLLVYFGWLGFQKEGTSVSRNYDSFSEIALPYILCVVVLGVGLYFANRAYVKQMYGRHISRLKAIIDEMKED